MSKSRILQTLVFILALVFLGIGMVYYLHNDRNLFTAIFLRTGAIFFLFGCFWTQLQKLPRWTDVGWLPLVAVAISWKTMLLKYAIPVSIILVFLNSPLGRGKYRQKSWRNIRKSFMNPTPRPREKASTGASAPNSIPSSASNATPSSDDSMQKESKRKNVAENTHEEPRQRSASNVRGPVASNVMFRAISRVAGRQVGKMMKNEKKK